MCVRGDPQPVQKRCMRGFSTTPPVARKARGLAPRFDGTSVPLLMLASPSCLPRCALKTQGFKLMQTDAVHDQVALRATDNRAPKPLRGSRTRAGRPSRISLSQLFSASAQRGLARDTVSPGGLPRRANDDRQTLAALNQEITRSKRREACSSKPASADASPGRPDYRPLGGWDGIHIQTTRPST